MVAPVEVFCPDCHHSEFVHSATGCAHVKNGAPACRCRYTSDALLAAMKFRDLLGLNRRAKP